MKKTVLFLLLSTLFLSCTKKDPRDIYCGEYNVQVNGEFCKWLIIQKYDQRWNEPCFNSSKEEKLTIRKSSVDESAVILEFSSNFLEDIIAYVTSTGIRFVNCEDHYSKDLFYGGTKYDDVSFYNDTLYFTSYSESASYNDWSSEYHATVDNWHSLFNEFIAVKVKEQE